MHKNLEIGLTRCKKLMIFEFPCSLDISSPEEPAEAKRILNDSEANL